MTLDLIAGFLAGGYGVFMARQAYRCAGERYNAPPSAFEPVIARYMLISRIGFDPFSGWCMKSAIIILATITALLIVALFLFVDVIPPAAGTRSTMHLTEYRIREYAARHQKLPASLADLPKLEGNRDSSTLDRWGRPIQYIVNGQTVTLLSLGKDGRPGGTGEDADIPFTFAIGDEATEPSTRP